MAQSNPPFMSGVPELLLLRLLDQSEMYGYELVRSIRAATGEAISLGEGVIYPVLHALERNGSLKSRRKAVGGRTRVYYSLTGNGRKRLEKLQADWRRSCRIPGEVGIVHIPEWTGYCCDDPVLAAVYCSELTVREFGSGKYLLSVARTRNLPLRCCSMMTGR